MQKFLQEWARAVAEAECASARAFCATPGARARALWEARQAERRAARLARVLQTRYGVDPHEMLRQGLIK
jgi:protein tyrosine phosphatase (PTP) superfamily phosphohydrolase (DUF442 family)